MKRGNGTLARASLAAALCAAAAAAAADPAGQCARALCGPPGDLATSMIIPSTFDQHFDPDGEGPAKFAEVEGDLRTMIRARLRINAALADLVKRRAQDGLDLDFERFSDQEFDNLAHILLGRRVMTRIDRNKPLPDRLLYDILPDPADSSVVDRGVEEFARRTANNIRASLHRAMEAKLYTDEEILSILWARWAAFSESLARIRTRDPGVLGTHEDILLSLRAWFWTGMSGGLQDAWTAATRLETLEAQLLEEGGLPRTWTRPLPDCPEGACRNGVRAAFRSLDFPDLAERLERSQEDPGDLEDMVVFHCRMDFAADSLRSCGRAEIDGLVESVRGPFVENALRGYSDAAKAVLEEHLDHNVDFKPFQPHGIDPAYLFHAFESRVRRDISEFRRLRGYEVLDDTDAAFLLLRYYQGSLDHPDPTVDLSCGNYRTSVDYVLHETPSAGIRKNTVFISPFSCQNPERGKIILAHELAHVLSRLFKQGLISGEDLAAHRSLRACATDSHPSETRGHSGIGFAGDKLRTEEDTADIIAALVFPDPSILKSCSGLAPSPDGTRYDARLLELDTDEATYHSPPFLRVLKEAVQKGIDLPPSCREVLDGRDDINLRMCS